ncbi:hypothetical protein RHCRD62_90118 [Rhodococcus sp. RD6.2]|nr:hypothetical protein RHCRD62_90118 [Rhodococcus sp. RD6.2]
MIRSQVLYPLSYGRMFFNCAGEPAAPEIRHCQQADMAEARGFEPPVPFEEDNSLAVSPIRPLWHAS